MQLQEAGYFLFLGAVALGYSMMPPRRRTLFLLACSAAFYALSSVTYMVMYLALGTVNYAAALRLSQDEGGAHRTRIFGGVVALNLAVLVTFKYLTHWIDSIINGPVPHADGAFRIAVPLGISYFTFQMVASVTDAYRRGWKPAGDWHRFLLFSIFFPQITSGPIPRPGRLLPQLSGDVQPTADDRAAGLRLIAYGLFKKFVVANRLNDYVTQIFSAQDPLTAPHYSGLPTLLGCIYNVLNLYADFSSYVDIAVGSARFIGIRLDPNFDRPFTSTSITEFWRRWHMTLSFWLRDYLYMPLLIRIRQFGMWGVIAALMFTFAVCGIWHDATWPYLIFGILQGAAMGLELLTKRWRTRNFKRLSARRVALAGWIYTVTFFMLSEVFFRSSSLGTANGILGALIRFEPIAGSGDLFAYKGPFDFIMNIVVVTLWLVVAPVAREARLLSTPNFVFLCAILVLFLGRLGGGQFIYAGF